MRSLLLVPPLALALQGLWACDDSAGAEGDAALPPAHDAARALIDALRPPGDGGPTDGTLLDLGGPAWDAVPPDAAPDPPDAAPGLPDAAPIDPACGENPDRPQQGPIDLRARCRAAGGPLRVRDLRDRRCADYEDLPPRAPGRAVVLDEVVVTGIYDADLAAQDPEGGTYSGVWLYNSPGLPLDGIAPGTRLRVRGQAIEFFTLTEIVLDAEDGLEIVGQGEPPAPIALADPARVADGGDLAEALESVLLEMVDVRVIDTAPDCPRDFGMFVVTGALRVDDSAPFDYAAARGDVLRRLVGVASFSFDHQKILPRNDADLDVVRCGGVPDKCETSECPVEPDAVEDGRLVVTEIQNNPRGDDGPREFVELYNPGPEDLDLTGWRVEDCAGNRAELSGRLAARDYHVIVGSLDRGDNGGVRGDGLMGELFLPNGFGSVLVFDAAENLVDQVRYEPVAPWPERFPGQSLEFLEPAADNRAGAAWAPAEESYGDGGRGSPGGPREP